MRVLFSRGPFEMSQIKIVCHKWIAVVVLVTCAIPAAAQQESFDCLIEPSTTIRLATPVSGVLTEVLVERGSQVEAGEVIARLDSALQQASLAIAEQRASNEAVIQGRQDRVHFLT